MIKNLNIDKDSNIVILTGAGISAESGLATFRASDGLWEGHRVEDVATPEAFVRNPDMVHNFYNERRAGLLDPKIQPNPAHKALARLEENWLGEVLVVTQNIDDLHERGGTKNLIHMHGEVLKAFCTHCRDEHGRDNETVDKFYIMQNKEREELSSREGDVGCSGFEGGEEPSSKGKNDVSSNTENAVPSSRIELCKISLSVEDECSVCAQTGGLRPDIVWFGEMPYAMNEIANALRDCDLFISIGTSGNVYPAAGFVQEALFADAYTVEINLDPSQNSSLFHESIQGNAGEKVPKVVERLLKS